MMNVPSFLVPYTPVLVVLSLSTFTHESFVIPHFRFCLVLVFVVSYFSFNQRMVLSIFYLLKQLIYYHIYFLKVFIHTLTYIVNCKHAINVFLSFVLSHTGVLLPELCERQRSSPHRIMSELLSSGVASGPTSSKASIHRTASAPAPL